MEYKKNNDLVLEILISTMNRKSLSFLKKMFANHDLEHLNILIINQTKEGISLISDKKNIRVINSFKKGLSQSRNLAIQNSIGDICLIADDDVEYFPDFLETIKYAFNQFKNASIIRFKIDTFEGVDYKPYPKKSKQIIKKKELLDSSSIEIAFKRSPIVKNDIKFNTLFGLGSHFNSGEEYLFLKEAISKNLIIYFENKSIVKHTLERSTTNMADDNFIKAQSAIYYLDYGFLSYVYVLKFVFFLLKKDLISLRLFIIKLKVGLTAIRIYKQQLNQK